MTQAVELPLAQERSAESKLVRGVCFAHFVSHIYITLLAPLFVFVREDYGVSYTQLGLALTAWSAVSTAFQTPMGFIIDRTNPRNLLIGALILGATAFGIAALVNSFWIFVSMFAVAGLANTVYHPADYALLSHHIPAARAGRIFSFHTFAGMAGNAFAPPALLFLYGIWGWRGAFLGASALGFVAAAVVVWQVASEPMTAAHRLRKTDDATPKLNGWKLLMSAPILLNLLFFILLSFTGGGLNNYLIVTLGALHGTPLTVANSALTSQLVLSAVGVLVGGMFTSFTSRPSLVAAGGLLVTATICVLVGLIDFGTVALILLMASAGFFSGVTMPSRDLIVRQVTPPGAYGRVFGFVSTGFNIAGIVSPTIFGQLLDRGYPQFIFFFMAACAFLAIATAFVSTSQRPA